MTTDAARKTFENKVRTAQMKEKMYSHGGGAASARAAIHSRTGVTAKIKGLDTLLFFALAEFHDIKEINYHLGSMNSTVIHDCLYGDKANLTDLSWQLGKAFGAMAEQGLERVGRWLDMYMEVLDFLPKIHKYTDRIPHNRGKPVRTNSLMSELPVMLTVLDKQLFELEPNRFAKLVNDTVRGDGNKLDRFLVTGFKGPMPLIKCLDYNVQQQWKQRVDLIETEMKSWDRLFKISAPTNVRNAAFRQRRY
jgi:hypothetical protein